MMEVLNKQEGHYFWQYDRSCFEEMSSSIFEADYWKEKNAITGQESGRGTTWFLKHKDHELVLRHYLRGGFIRHLSHDRYIFTGMKNTRSIAEFDILTKLLEKKLPVPKPAATQVIKHGLFYEADLLTHKIPSAQDLVQVLQHTQAKEFFQELGSVIAKFHQLGVFHADMNIQNILQDNQGKFWLIDFDRAQILTPHAKWQQATLNRLKRSFEKERGRFDIRWDDKDWDAFMKGYKL